MTNSNSDILATVSANIDAFIALPVYRLLSDVPSDLSLKLFVPSKDNTSILSGTQELWRSIDVSQFDFTLPDPVDMPDVDGFPDTVKGMKDFKDAMNAYKSDGKPYNDAIKSLTAKLINHDIKRKYDRLVHVCQFVQSHDASQFEHDEELDLFDLPETTCNKILQVYRNAFKADPRLLMTGSSINLLEIDPLCSLDSIDGIDRIIAIKNSNPSASYAFMGADVLTQAFKAVKNELNAPSAIKMLKRLDCHLGGSKNSTTIIASLRMLYGMKPNKGKKSAA